MEGSRTMFGIKVFADRETAAAPVGASLLDNALLHKTIFKLTYIIR
jgi:hypothetical protein